MTETEEWREIPGGYIGHSYQIANNGQVRISYPTTTDGQTTTTIRILKPYRKVNGQICVSLYSDETEVRQLHSIDALMREAFPEHYEP